MIANFHTSGNSCASRHHAIFADFAVVSDMNYQELSNEFGEELKPFTPFLILTEEQGEEIIRYNRNQEKFDWRMRNKEAQRQMLQKGKQGFRC